MSDNGFEPRLIGFLCRWCSYNGADLAGTSRLKYPPNMVPIKTNCSGRVDPTHIMKAFAEGADGVIIAGCHPGDCHYINGNYRTAGRYPLMEKLLEQLGLEHGRVRLEWVSAAEGDKFAARGRPSSPRRSGRSARWAGARQFNDEAAASGRGREGGGVGMSKFKFAMYWAGSCGGCEIALLEINEKIIEVDRGLRRRLLAGGRRLQVQGPRGLRRRLHRRLPVQRLHPQLRERAHRQRAARQEQGAGRLRRLRRHGRHPGPGQRGERPGDQGPRLHAEPVARQPRQGLPAGALHGARGRARAAPHVRHRQDARPDRRRRLLHAGLPARGAPDRRRARRRHRGAQGQGRAARQGRDHRRRPQDRAATSASVSKKRRRSTASSASGSSSPIPRSACSSRASSAWVRRRAPAAGRAAPASAWPAAAATAPPEGVVDQGAKMLSTRGLDRRRTRPRRDRPRSRRPCPIR